MSNEAKPDQETEWQLLHDKITETLDHFGKKDAFGNGDYWLLDDNWGWHRHQLEFQNLKLFEPRVVKLLQALLADFPEWDITARVDVIGKEKVWPGMGLLITSTQIIDDLQREFLPEEFRNFVYEGAKSPKRIDMNEKSYIFRRALR